MNAFFAMLGVAVAAYVVGSIPFGLLIGKWHKIDIRKHGSGNIGATNITRTLGRDWGIFCFFLDFCKGMLPVVIAQQTVGSIDSLPSALLGIPGILAAAAAISGHIWPVFLRFKGGKGMATSLGALVALAPFHVIICAITWYLVFLATRYVSMASIAAALALPLGGIFIRTSWPTTTLLIAITILIVYKHRSNIVRLLEGTENRFERQPGKKQK